MRQQTARRIGVSMDGLKLASSWSRAGLKRLVQQERGEAQIVDVRGLLIQGAAFDGRALVEAEANASELAELDSTVSLAFVPRDEGGVYAEGESIGVPLYFSTARERVLDEVSLPISGRQAQWVMAGKAQAKGCA